MQLSRKQLFFFMALAVVVFSTPAFAGDSDPLFINLTTDDSHAASMAITFGKNQMDRGHPLTIFLNDKAVFVGSKTNGTKYSKQQQMLTEVMGKGAVVLACPMCMGHHAVKEGDLLQGIKVSNPETTGNALFKDKTVTMTW